MGVRQCEGRSNRSAGGRPRLQGAVQGSEGPRHAAARPTSLCGHDEAFRGPPSKDSRPGSRALPNGTPIGTLHILEDRKSVAAARITEALFGRQSRRSGVRPRPQLHTCFAHNSNRLNLAEHKKPWSRPVPPAGFEPATRRLEDVGAESARVHPCRPRPLDQDFHRAGDR